MLFDKDEDGVLSFPELAVVMKSLGQRPSGKAKRPTTQFCVQKYPTFTFSHILSSKVFEKPRKSWTFFSKAKKAKDQSLAFVSDDELLKMVQEVSEDPVYHTIEFNEFLQLLSKQQASGTTRDSLTDAFRYIVPQCSHTWRNEIFENPVFQYI